MNDWANVYILFSLGDNWEIKKKNSSTLIKNTEWRKHLLSLWRAIGWDSKGLVLDNKF